MDLPRKYGKFPWSGKLGTFTVFVARNFLYLINLQIESYLWYLWINGCIDIEEFYRRLGPYDISRTVLAKLNGILINLYTYTRTIVPAVVCHSQAQFAHPRTGAHRHAGWIECHPIAYFLTTIRSDDTSRLEASRLGNRRGSWPMNGRYHVSLLDVLRATIDVLNVVDSSRRRLLLLHWYKRDWDGMELPSASIIFFVFGVYIFFLFSVSFDFLNFFSFALPPSQYLSYPRYFIFQKQIQDTEDDFSRPVSMF